MRNIGDSPKRLDAVRKALEAMSGNMTAFYMTMGEYDFVAICEMPDDAVAACFILTTGQQGFVRTLTLKAFPEQAYREIVKSLG